MPELPMPGVNGHVVGSPALHISLSISSFAPAARTAGWLASTASAGSFCLFCANGDAGLAWVTFVSEGTADPDAGMMNATPKPSAATATMRRRHIVLPSRERPREQRSLSERSGDMGVKVR